MQRYHWASPKAQKAADAMGKILTEKQINKSALIDMLIAQTEFCTYVYEWGEEKIYATQAVYNVVHTHGIRAYSVGDNVSRSVSREAFFSENFAEMCYGKEDAKAHIIAVSNVREQCADIVRQFYPEPPVFFGHSNENWLV